MAAVICVAGWLSIYFAEVCATSVPKCFFFRSDFLCSHLLVLKGALALDIGRLATGYGMGVFSYVVWSSLLFQHLFLVCLFICATNYGLLVDNDFDAVVEYDGKVPVFIAEISPKNLRGALTTLNQVKTYSCEN